MTDRPIFAFVLMPFASHHDDVYQVAILDAAKSVDIRAERLSDQLYAEGMLERIYRQIELADIVVADVSGRNPNVFYEVGYAHAKEKLCILITDDADHIPFDLKHRRHIVYGQSLTFLRDELSRHFAWAKQEVETVRKSQLRVELAVTGLVNITEYRAIGNIDITLDIHNNSDRDTQELHGIYFYLGNDWHLTQDGNECAKSNSDVANYSFRYLIRPPMGKVVPGGWMQARIKGSRTLAQKWRGDVVLREYRLSGRALVRLLTARGTFEYEVPVDVLLYDLPF